MVVEPGRQATGVGQRLAGYPLLSALRDRRSQRFARGMRLNGGPLAYTSSRAPEPLTLEEEAALAFAAAGITGYALAELPYQTGDVPEAGAGNIMSHFVGRTVASPDALHAVRLVVINDEGTWLLKRPQDFAPGDIGELIELARRGEFVALYERGRVKIADDRRDIPRVAPYLPAFNKWSANVPGTTYFVPVAELSAMYINIMLSAFDDGFNYMMVDDRNFFQPAGLGRFRRSKGGHLDDDPKDERTGTVDAIETWLCEFASIEIGGMVQNLGLMAQALGIGGFPHFGAHPFGWTRALGFRMEDVPVSRVSGMNPVMRRLVRALGKDLPVPTALGLEVGGEVLLKPFCPPYYRTMEEAVLAFIGTKYSAGSGAFRSHGEATAWRDPDQVQAGIPLYSERAIDATISYCSYVYERYGRFPAKTGPVTTMLAYQAHHLDPDFYDRFYRPGSLSERQLAHQGSWHGEGAEQEAGDAGE